MRFEYDDGGREAAGFRGKKAGDCVTRAIAIASGKAYREIYDDFLALAKKEKWLHSRERVSHPNTGVYKKTYHPYVLSLGFVWVPTMKVGVGCKVHLREDELPPGRLIVSLSKHIVAVIDGVVHDTYDPSREGMRCVYGYYMRSGT